jgi:cytochrome c553
MLMRGITWAVIGLCALPLAQASTLEHEGDPAQAPAVVRQTCASCHGIDGNSTSPGFPKLAAQVPQYLRKQLADFKSGARKNPIMSGMAAGLSSREMDAVAAYFGVQAIKADTGQDKALVDEGEKIYHGGITTNAVPACAACHGTEGTGTPPLYPRLADQHAAYLVTQLQNFKAKKRDNDPKAVMRDIAGRMSTQQMQAVAAYLSGLRQGRKHHAG